MNDLFTQRHDLGKGQVSRLNRWLSAGHTVTSLEAWKHLGIARLASRVHDLKDAGVPVRDRWIEVTNQYGESCRVKEYYK
jgi:hypothetical protein